MRGSKVKTLFQEAKQINCDEAERKWVMKQLKRGQRYVSYFDAEYYQPRYIDRTNGKVYAGMMPSQLKAVRLS